MHMIRVAKITGGPLDRGLYTLPFTSDEGYPIVYALRSNHKLTQSGLCYIRQPDDWITVVDQLVDELEKADPMSDQVRRRLLKVG